MQKIDKYSVKKELGRGGAGVVYLAQHPLLHREVAVKVLSHKHLDDTSFKQRFAREAQLAAKLTHENVTTVYDFGYNEEGNPFLVMDYVEGSDLRAILGSEQGLPLQKAVDFFIQICRGLQAIHEAQIVHCDIKPGNIYIQNNGRVKIMDLGVARILSNDTVKDISSGTFGTVRYMSPEQLTGSEVDVRSDVFSLGVLMYECLAGENPFAGHAREEIAEAIRHEAVKPLLVGGHKVLEEMALVVDRCLQKNPENRFQSITELEMAIHEALEITMEDGQQTWPDLEQIMVPLRSDLPVTDNTDPEDLTLPEARQFVTWYDEDPRPDSGAVTSNPSSRGKWVLIFSSLLIATAAILAFNFSSQDSDSVTPDMKTTVTETKQHSPRSRTKLAKMLMEKARNRATFLRAEQASGSAFQRAADMGKKAQLMQNGGQLFEADSLFRLAADLYGEAATQASKTAALVKQEPSKAVANSASKKARLPLKERLVEKEKTTGKTKVTDAATITEQNKRLTKGSKSNRKTVAVAASRKDEIGKKKKSQAVKKKKPAAASPNALAQSEARHLKKTALEAKANAFSPGIFQLANKALQDGNAAFAAKRMTDAGKAFRRSSELFQRAIDEKGAIQTASVFYAAAEYDSCLLVLGAVLKPFDGTEVNPVAIELSSRAKEAAAFLNAILFSAETTAKRGELRTALDILQNLPLLEQQSGPVQNLIADIKAADKAGPEVLHHPHLTYDKKEILLLTATVTDNIAVDKVTLFFRLDEDAEYETVLMKAVDEEKNNGVFAAAFDQSLHLEKDIEYYFVATDNAGNRSKQYLDGLRPYRIKAD